MIICSFFVINMFYKIVDWVSEKLDDVTDENFKNWLYLSLNPNAIEFLKQNQEYIDWTFLSSNPNSFELLAEKPYLSNWYYLSFNKNKEILSKILEPNLMKANWNQLSINSSAGFILKKNKKYINYDCLCINNCNEAIDLILENNYKINYSLLSRNENDRAVDLLFYKQDKINWREFSANSNDRVINFLYQNPNKIHWRDFSQNMNPKAIKLMKENKDKLYWDYLATNPNDEILDFYLDYHNYDFKRVNEFYLCNNTNSIAINFIKPYKNKLNKYSWTNLISNPSIFTLDYDKISENFSNLKEEIIKEVMHPRRICKYLELEGYDYIEEMFGY